MQDRTHRQRWDDYLYTETGGLRNHLNITDTDTWGAAETNLVAARTQTLPKFGFDTGHVSSDLKAIHQHLFQDCYAWAGKFRDVNMSKEHPQISDSISFLPWQTIEDNLTVVNDQIQLTEWDNLGTEQKINALATLHGELNTIHPFREGNGRVTRSFMEQLSARYDITINWQDSKEALHLVSAVSMTHESGLDVELWKDLYGQIATESTWDNEPITGIDEIFDVVDLSPTPRVNTSLIDMLGISATTAPTISSTPPGNPTPDNHVTITAPERSHDHAL